MISFSFLNLASISLWSRIYSNFWEQDFPISPLVHASLILSPSPADWCTPKLREWSVSKSKDLSESASVFFFFSFLSTEKQVWYPPVRPCHRASNYRSITWSLQWLGINVLESPLRRYVGRCGLLGTEEDKGPLTCTGVNQEECHSLSCTNNHYVIWLLEVLPRPLEKGSTRQWWMPSHCLHELQLIA